MQISALAAALNLYPGAHQILLWWTVGEPVTDKYHVLDGEQKKRGPKPDTRPPQNPKQARNRQAQRYVIGIFSAIGWYFIGVSPWYRHGDGQEQFSLCCRFPYLIDRPGATL